MTREDLIRKAKIRRPLTPLELWLYVAVFFKFQMPWKACCPSHDTPFDMLWQLWVGNPASFIAIGARDSYKTLTLAASETLDLIHNACGVVHIGAIESQAMKCYAYVKRNLSSFPELLSKPPLMSKTELDNGGRLEIIPCTINRVNSPHEPKVRFDEVELADPISYNEAKFIAASDEKGNQASIVYTTTRKYAHGLAQKEVEAAIASNRRVLLWCYKDVTEHCSDDRSGTDPVEIFVDTETLVWGRTRSKKEQQPFKVFNKCLDCKIVASCRADLKRASGIKKIDDVILKFENSSLDYWMSQMECKRPSRKGLMIHRFNPDVNKIKIDRRIFMDREGRFDHERFFIVWGKDWGWNPDATLVCVIDRTTDRVYVVKEFAFRSKTTIEVAEELKHWCRATFFGFPSDIQCDRSEPGLIATFQANGFPMAAAVEETDIEGGCDLINYLCQPLNHLPMLYIDSEECPELLWEITVGYTRVTDPHTNEPGEKARDKNNHFVDALRYALWRYMRKYLEAAGSYSGGLSVGGGGTMQSGILIPSEQGIIDEGQMELLSLLLKSDR